MREIIGLIRDLFRVTIVFWLKRKLSKFTTPKDGTNLDDIYKFVKRSGNIYEDPELLKEK